MTLFTGQRRRFKNKRLQEARGDCVVLEVHDMPAVDWTNEPTALVRYEKDRNRDYNWKQESLLEHTEAV